MFYHINIGVTGITSHLEKNLTKENALLQYLCPFISKEITFSDGKIENMSSFGNMSIFATEKPIDSDWPIKVESTDTDPFKEYEHKNNIVKSISENDVTEILFKEAITLIEYGRYKDYRASVIAGFKSKTVFMISSFENEEVDHNYEFIIQPSIEKHGLKIERVDQISHTQQITDKILDSINNALFVIADLTDVRPNCYYEVGYAHALGKPVIILAKEGTERHFDISTYKWNYWTDYKDLKPKIEKEINSILNEFNITNA